VSEDGAVNDAADQWAYFPPPGLPARERDAPVAAPFTQRWAPPALTALGATVALVLLGAPLALLWRAFAPVVAVAHTAGGPQPVAPESNQMFAVDGRFVLVTLVVGALLGAASWYALRERGPAAPVGLAAGGLLAALVMSAVGRRIVVDRYLYDFCHGKDVRCIVYDGTLHLHATAAIVVLPVALLAAFMAMTFLFDQDPSPAVPALPAHEPPGA
jgi:hypothetical protein